MHADAHGRPPPVAACRHFGRPFPSFWPTGSVCLDSAGRQLVLRLHSVADWGQARLEPGCSRSSGAGGECQQDIWSSDRPAACCSRIRSLNHVTLPLLRRPQVALREHVLLRPSLPPR